MASKNAWLLLLLSLGPVATYDADGGRGPAEGHRQRKSEKPKGLSRLSPNAHRRTLNTCSAPCGDGSMCSCISTGRRLFGAAVDPCYCTPAPSPPPSPSPAPSPPPPPPFASTRWRIANYDAGASSLTYATWCVGGIRFYSDEACTTAPSYIAISHDSAWGSHVVNSAFEDTCYDSIDWNTPYCGTFRCSDSYANQVAKGAWVEVEYAAPTTIRCAVAWYITGHQPMDWATSQQVLLAYSEGSWIEASLPTTPCWTVGSCPQDETGGTNARKMTMNL